MKNLFLLICASLLFAILAPAALTAQTTEKEPLYFQTYTIEHGLSDNWIRDIAQDQQGYLWLATGSGVSRFDGYEFDVFLNDPADFGSLSNNDAFAVFADRNNNIWVATANGIDLFDRASRTFSRYTTNIGTFSNLYASPVGKFYESKKGTLYIGTTQGLITFYDDKKVTRVLTSGNKAGLEQKPLAVTSITESEDGRIWIGTNGGGIHILNPETDEITRLQHNPEDDRSLPNNNIFNLFIDQQQVLWVNYDRRENQLGAFFSGEYTPPGSESGLWKKELNTGKVTNYRYKPEGGSPLWTFISDFEQTKDGKIWITQSSGAEAGLRLYDDKSDTFYDYAYNTNNPGSIPWDFTTALIEDRFGHLWVGTSRGLARAARNQIQMGAFTPYPADKYNLINNFYGIEELDSNQFLLSSDGSTVIYWNRANNRWNEINDLYPNRVPLVSDGKNRVWLLSIENTIERYDIGTTEKEIFDLNDTATGSITINHFLRLSEDLLLIATDAGLWSLTPSSGQFKKITISLPFSANEEPDIIHLAADSAGKIWLGINNVSLDSTNTTIGILTARYDPKTGQTMFPAINDPYLSALGNGFVNYLMTDSRGWVWISKSNGLVRLDPKANRTTYYTTQSGLQHQMVRGTLEDRLGMIWISTEYGISRLNPDTGTIRNFGKDDGLRPTRMNAYSFYKRGNGELMFGGVGGLSYFQPEDFQETGEAPLIDLVRLEAEETIVNFSGNTKLPELIEIQWGTNSISLEFASVNFRNPGETTYSYKLEGFHKNWVNADKHRFAQFSNLPPDTYTFLVKAINADGLSSAEPASVTFRVLPPWWRSWWAYGFYFILLIAGIITANKVQRKRLQQKEREKVRERELEQAKEIEKAYRNLEVAHENLKSAQDQLIQQEKLASLGQLTAGIAHEIKNPLNFVNNFSELSIELVAEAREEISSRQRSGRDLNPDSDSKIDSSTADTPHNPLSGRENILKILDDIEANLKTIHKHGSRADSIVKSMLEHSRGGSGKPEPTDLNALVKEFVNLSFHGMRAGKNPINVDMAFELDETVGKVPLIAEDFSRVIVNLSNNAFDAMREKVIKDSSCKPRLRVTTKMAGANIEIQVEDNGPGIPDHIKDNILQPFFTTKKGTEGTGLGLSITHDIIKAHGGELEVETKKGNGSVFVISLPNSETRI